MYENMLNFYENLDLKYPEVAISLQEINKEYPGVVKFSIPILTPSIDNSKIVHKSFHLNRRNLKNKDNNLDIHNIIKITNYIEIPMSRSICINEPELGFIPSGSKWIVIFIGGDITKPRIIGRYLE